MGTRDPRIDAYIDKAADFAKPILRHLREVVHAGCPEVEETIKWSAPFFDYKGSVLCNMAAFKSHCAFGFWKGSLLAEKYPELANTTEGAMGHLGRITALSDLPDDETLLLYIREAAALNEQGIKTPRAKPKGDRELEVPDDLMDALRKSPQALATFEGFSYSNKKEYVEWVTEAKSEATRQRRLDQAVEWMAEGRVRNWKYVRK